jgi:hypothetical protein
MNEDASLIKNQVFFFKTKKLIFLTFIFIGLDEEQAHRSHTTPDQVRQLLKKPLEYYFSEQNMHTDTYLKSQMDEYGYVSIAIIANFNNVKRLTNDIHLIIDALKGIEMKSFCLCLILLFS